MLKVRIQICRGYKEGIFQTLRCLYLVLFSVLYGSVFTLLYGFIYFYFLSDISHLKSWILRDPEEIEHEVEAVPTVHEQEDGTILGCCATGSSSRDSLLSWIRFLEKTNPKLADFPVLFTLKSPLGNFFST